MTKKLLKDFREQGQFYADQLKVNYPSGPIQDKYTTFTLFHLRFRDRKKEVGLDFRKALFFVHQIDVKRVSISKRTPTYFSFVSRQESSRVASQKHHENAMEYVAISFFPYLFYILFPTNIPKTEI